MSELLGFGKYKGKTIEQVIAVDAQYILWAEEKGLVRLNSDMQEAAAECASIQHVEWLRERCENEQCVEF